MLTHMFSHANTNIDDNGISHRNSWEKEAYEFGLD